MMIRLARNIISFTMTWLVLCMALHDAQADILVSARSSNSILRYDEQTGAPLGELVTGNAAANGGLDGPVGMRVGPDGNLYVVSSGVVSGEGRVLMYDLPTGNYLGDFATGTPLQDPADLRFDSQGNLFVGNFGRFYLNQFEDNVVQYASDGTSLGEFASDAGVVGASYLTFGPDDNLYVSSFGTGSVLRFDGTTGSLIDTYATNAGIFGTSGMLFHDDWFYVASLLNHQIYRFSASDPLQSSLFIEVGAESYPSDLVVGPNGNLLVTTLGYGEVREYDLSDGSFLGTFAGGIAEPAQMLITPVPEPSTLVLLGLGSLGAIVVARRQRKRHARRQPAVE